jgi:hypothetical protein
MLTARLAGRPEDQGRVYLRDFLSFFEDVLAALRKVDEIVSDGRETAHYRVAELATGSAAMEIEAVPRPGMPDHGPLICARFTEAALDLEQAGIRPPGFDYDAFQAFRKLARPLRRGAQSVEFEHETTLVLVTSRLEANVERLLGHEVTTRGAVSGQLDVVNVHDAPCTFRIYPVVGPGRVTCRFSKALLPQVGAALNRHVTVAGVLHYRAEEPFPYEVDAQALEIHPPEDELPTLDSLRGMAPEITGDMDTVSFLRMLRSGEES